MMTRSILVVVLVAAFVGGAAAQSNKAAAAAAFDHAKELQTAGKIEEACAEFARSQQLDPQLGTQYNLALCYEKLGKLASAYVEFDELAAKDTNAKRKADSKKRKAKLEARLTRLLLVVNNPAPQLTVKRGDEDITMLVGVTTPVDPGVYVFRAEAPGRTTWEQQVDLTAEGATITVEIPALPEAAPGETTPDETPVDDDARPLPETPSGGGKSGGGRKILGLSIAGAGAVATGVGVFFGVQASGLKGEAEDACNGSLDPCTGDITLAQTKIDDARSKANLSNVLVGVGLAAVAGGIILWVTAPDGESRETALVPVIGADGVGLALDGRW
jgi:hypothetical protein